MTMTRLQLNEVLDGIVNQLSKNEKAEIITKLLDIMTTKQKKEIYNYFQVNFPTDTRISLEENGIVEIV